MSVVESTSEFDICGPLPRGVIVLEASAGTGKTYTIAALAARYVADGVPVDQLLLVTFTRLATGELRDRVRQRLATARRALEAALSVDGAPDPDAVDAGDLLARMLATGPLAEVEARRHRLVHAIADLDAATITTTHGFCQEVLSSFGVAGDVDRGHSFSDDARDLVDEVVDDLYVNNFLGRAPLFPRAQAGEVALAAVRNPTASLATVAPSADGAAELRRALAAAARAELDRRKRALALMTYDDLVTRLRETLEGPHGAQVAAQLRARYRVALVDEFQDTDPDQWAIMRTATATSPSSPSPSNGRPPRRPSPTPRRPRSPFRPSEIIHSGPPPRSSTATGTSSAVEPRTAGVGGALGRGPEALSLLPGSPR